MFFGLLEIGIHQLLDGSIESYAGPNLVTFRLIQYISLKILLIVGRCMNELPLELLLQCVIQVCTRPLLLGRPPQRKLLSLCMLNTSLLRPKLMVCYLNPPGDGQS